MFLTFFLMLSHIGPFGPSLILTLTSLLYPNNRGPVEQPARDTSNSSLAVTDKYPSAIAGAIHPQQLMLSTHTKYQSKWSSLNPMMSDIPGRTIQNKTILTMLKSSLSHDKACSCGFTEEFLLNDNRGN